ncbi:MAG: PHP domain-containing protein [Deltaproteobacteria bacterium]|nr:PHP domain-containing protein [Deltaproteobacteria bacterium]
MIDLHTHSTASDGTLTPSELVDAASEAGLTALALTDHDTVAGVAEALDAAARRTLVFISGVEISARMDRGALHIVGLHVDHENRELTRTLDNLVELRNARNLKMIEKLCDLGLTLTIDEVKALAKSVVGKPHFATAMVNRGYVKNNSEAFIRYLTPGTPAYVSKERLERRRAIELIRAAGGVPILAHPRETKLEGRDLENLVRDLADIGLEGIEVFCSGHDPGRCRRYSRLAERYGLVRSGGSDFHGAIKPDIRLGRGPGKLFVPDDLVDPIADRAEQVQKAAT